MVLALLATFWIAVGLFLLLAPDHLFRSGNPRTRRYAAAGCVVFAASCIVGLIAT